MQILLLALAACGNDPDSSAATADFTTGTPEELAEAESIAYDRLLAEDGEATTKRVDGLRTLKVSVDDLSMAHARVQQLVGDVPVWGGEAIVHLEPNGRLAGVTDALLPHVVVDTTPDYAEDEAIDLAVAAAGGWAAQSDDAQADLWVLRRDGADHLVWRVQLHELRGGDGDSLPVVFVDAHTGDVVWSYENLQSLTCSGTTNFYSSVSVDCLKSSTTYYLEDSTDLLGTYSWGNGTSSLSYVSSTSTTFGTTTATKNAVEAAYVQQKVYDYYKSTFGRNGIDGAGGPAAVTSHGYSYITSTANYSRSYVNAYWDPTSLYMVYGGGDGVNSKSLTTLDIGGHEMTHGVTQYEANLTYSGESGALNESFSDVFGAMVERSVEGTSANTWIMGEETWTPSVAGDGLRYLDDPAADGYSEDYYSSSVTPSDDVHYSSGIGNLAFYLLAQGGTRPTGKSTTVVTGIGADEAAQIWYLALTSYMTSSTDYAGARTATLAAASALYGATSTEYTQVGNAWAAVGVGGSAGGGGGSCSTTTYTGTFTKKGQTAYAPSSAGTAVTVTGQSVSLTGAAGTNFDVYLDKKGASWANVASGTGASSTESVSYTGTSGTYRVRVYSKTGTGAFTLSWCK